MKPYYEQDGITIYHGDCRDVLSGLASESVAVVVTDPPYGIGYNSGFYKNGNPFGALRSDDITNAVWLPYIAVLIRPDGASYCFSRWDVLGTWKSLFKFFGLEAKSCIVWDKTRTGMGDLSGAYAPSHEMVLFTARGRHTLRRGRKPDLLSVQRVGAKRDHPTEKPPELMAEFILNSSDEGDTVLDPFCGVGPTLIAAQRNGRKAIGIEIEERYCEVAAKRLAQGSLFSEQSA
jgi:site-specific DNA-methyltransferase (adenine-specific)